MRTYDYLSSADLAKNEISLSFDDIGLVPRYSFAKSRSFINISPPVNTSFLPASPIINAPMVNVASEKMLEYFKNENMFRTVHRFFSHLSNGSEIADAQIKLANGIDNDTTWFAVGSIYSNANAERHMDAIRRLHDKGVRNYLIDIAHGDSIHSLKTIQFIRTLNDKASIIAGNVADGLGYCTLAEEEITAVRVGIASGAACSTFVNTGFGLPTLYAVSDAHSYRMSNRYKTMIIADGGIRNSGDIVKSIWAGADLVMIGKVLAGTSLADGIGYTLTNGKLTLTDDINDMLYREYFGMASKRMLTAYKNVNASAFSAEGEAGLVQYLGETHDVLTGIHNNLRSALSYGGSSGWLEFRQYVNCRLISQSSSQEKKVNLDKVIK